MRLVSLLPSAEIDMADLLEQAGFAQSNHRTSTIAGLCSVQLQVARAGLG
jgi:hypothetical protein